MNRSGNINSYNHNVRIGNWNEDKELNDEKMKDYLKKKANNQLLVTQVQAHLNKSLQEAQLSYSADDCVRFGDSIMLYSVRTEGVLSVDMSTKITSSDLGYSVTTSTLTEAPVARNVFTIEGIDGSVKAGDPLKLAQPFRLRTNEGLGQSFWLQSQPVSTMSYSKQSHNQEVCVIPSNTTRDTVWMCQFKDINRRFEMEGTPVPSNAEILLQHANTKTALASDKLATYNDFGNEWEVCSASNISVAKKQGLYQERLGLTTADIPVRAESNTHFWALLTSADDAPETEVAL